MFIILTNQERVLLREVELSLAPVYLRGAFKRIRRDDGQDNFVAPMNVTEVRQLLSVVSQPALECLPSCQCIPGLVKKLTALSSNAPASARTPQEKALEA